MKNIPCYFGLMAASFCAIAVTASGQNGWQSQSIHRHFHTEGASAGDIDSDGHVDIVAGPVWYAGPNFERSHPIDEPKTFPVANYSDQFFSFVVEINHDDAPDVIVFGFPGEPARLYLNPGRDYLYQPWKESIISGPVDNESPLLMDLIDGGLPEIVCGSGGQYGYYSAGQDPTSVWTWTPVTRPGVCDGRFAHGLGVGDIDGDGRADLIDKSRWWRQPASDGAESWKQETWNANPGRGGAQICVGDIDGDGDADILTSLNAHGFGLSWFSQDRSRKTGGREFIEHPIMGRSSQDNPFGVVFSQLHAVALADIDGDGVSDIVTGKRFMAHHGKDEGGLQMPVLYWFQAVRSNDGVEFVPHLIDDDSGVGVEVLVTDVNADGKPDVISSNKRGLTIHRQDASIQVDAPERWQVSAGKDQSTYADGWSPSEAARNMLVPDGFAVDLIAAEPELTQPIAMCFDARGRIWVIEGHTYPTKAPEGKGRDRILILEDADADGSFESSKVFADGINLASGIEVGFGGVWVGAAPELLFFPDANHDDIPDADPTVVLDGWGYEDTHETLNSFTWGPDGWLYGCHGVFTHSRVGKPGTPDDERVGLNAGVWRYHPTRDTFEVFAHGTSNPWGVDFDENGEWFVTACVIEHLFHIQQGGRYKRQAGSHFNPHTYADIQTIADHSHYVGSVRDHAFWGENRESRPSAPNDTSMVGGGHAHCGLAIYDGNVFPRSYRGEMLFHNLHGHRVVREHLETCGSGFIARHRPDFALSQDHQQIGVGIMVGPDGAIYTSDWHDPQTCHNRTPEVWNRTDGRLFRIRYGDVRPQAFDLWKASDEDLIQWLASDNGFMARQSSRILQERLLQPGPSTVGSNRAAVVAAMKQHLAPEHSRRDRLRALWMLGAVGELNDEFAFTLLDDDEPYVRGWTVHFQGQSGAPISVEMRDRLARLAESDPSSVVRRFIASLANRIPVEQRFAMLSGLATHSIDRNDPNIPHLVWFALEPIVPSDPKMAFDIAKRSGWPDLVRHVIRRTATTESGRETLAEKLADPKSTRDRLVLLEELASAARSRGGIAMPAAWPTAMNELKKASNADVRRLSRRVAVSMGDASVIPYFRNLLADRSRPIKERVSAMESLATVGDDQLVSQMFDLLDDSAMATQAVLMLGRFPEPRTPERLLSQFDTFEPSTQTAVLTTLASRKPFADALVRAMESGSIPPSDVPAFVIRQATTLGDDTINSRLEKVWGKISVSSAEKQSQYKKYRSILAGPAFARADRRQGRVLYEANCGKCHKLFGVGGDIGPAVTGANRTSVDYWLENILEPNALIGRAYQTTKFLTTDGRVISGLVKDSNDDAVTVQTANEVLVLPREDVEQEVLADTSLMPEGQLEPMTEDEVRQLFNYLRSPNQVELP